MPEHRDLDFDCVKPSNLHPRRQQRLLPIYGFILKINMLDIPDYYRSSTAFGVVK